MAKEISSWSKDPSSQIGAVAIGSKGQVLATGFNGFPRGIEDSESRLNEREVKYKHNGHLDEKR
jgi:dCMP deaminase